MNSLRSDVSKFWLEYWGRRRTAPRYPFRENEIVSPGSVLQVSPFLRAVYLNLHPTHYAVMIGPDGRIMNMRGGYSPLPPGRYILHYVDKQNRVIVIPRTTEFASDGPQVCLEVVITYRVIDAVKALDVQQAVDTLVVFIQSDLKEFIRTHKYDDIVGDLYGRKVDNELVVRFIKDQHATRHQMSRLFFIADVVVKEKLGDQRVSDIRQKIQINQWQYDADSEFQRQNQALSEKGFAQEALIRKMQAESEAKQLEILKDVKLQQIELDNARQQFQAQQAYVQRAMDALVQAFSSQMYPLDPHVIEIMRDLVETMGGSLGRKAETVAEPKNQPPPPPDESAKTEKIGKLTNTLLNLLDRKRP